jgi:hypothetical protein
VTRIEVDVDDLVQVATATRQLRHAAHVYHTSRAENRHLAEEALYIAARRYAAAWVLQESEKSQLGGGT